MSLRDWLGNQLAKLLLGDALVIEAPPPPAEDQLQDAPPDAPLLGPEAERMLAAVEAAPRSSTVLPPPPLEGSREERLARLRRL